MLLVTVCIGTGGIASVGNGRVGKAHAIIALASVAAHSDGRARPRPTVCARAHMRVQVQRQPLCTLHAGAGCARGPPGAAWCSLADAARVCVEHAHARRANDKPRAQPPVQIAAGTRCFRSRPSLTEAPRGARRDAPARARDAERPARLCPVVRWAAGSHLQLVRPVRKLRGGHRCPPAHASKGAPCTTHGRGGDEGVATRAARARKGRRMERRNDNVHGFSPCAPPHVRRHAHVPTCMGTGQRRAAAWPCMAGDGV